MNGQNSLVVSSSRVSNTHSYHRIPNHNRKISLQIQLVLHMLVSGGIALSAIGGSKLAKPESATNKYSNDRALRKIGPLIIFLTTVLLISYALYTYRRLKSLPSARLNRSVIRLLHFAMLALPFTYIRAIYSIVYSFDTSPSVNPITGVFAVKFILIFLVQLLATLSLVVGGIMTRNIRIEDKTILSSPGYASSEPRRGGPNEQHIMNEYGVVQGQEAKDLASQYRGVR